jgi:hypothetical protein
LRILLRCILRWLRERGCLSNRNFTERRRRMPLSLHSPPEGRCFEAANRRRMPGFTAREGNREVAGRMARRRAWLDADPSELARR